MMTAESAKPKGGRPCEADAPRGMMIRVRVTPWEFERLRQLASEAGKPSLSAYLRDCSLRAAGTNDVLSLRR